MRLLKKIILLFIGLYVLLCAAVYFMPEKFFFLPFNFQADLKKVRADGFDAEEVLYHIYPDGQEVKGWLALNKTPENNGKIVLFLHGNAFNLGHYYHKVVPFYKAGYSVFLPEHRGFGGQGNKIRQRFLEEDSLKAVSYLHQLGFENKDIVVYGMSLGTHQALYAAVHTEDEGLFEGVVLEVPFTSFLDTIQSRLGWGNLPPIPLPLDLLIRDAYDNTALMPELQSRVLVMMTESDWLVPPQQAKDLYALAKAPKTLVSYQSGIHENLYYLQNYKEILAWLKTK